ncbi:hypothetical protein Murru_1439 [Allomuricauda ruestringensis DSM 13258]|uniref:Collagen triple helix repeat-containing protein n=1 Tax=Allomuricauda ruestringensis (strain DSM 13258 / CIP 107369 / LMG 19739 / B1) TaxID=886377 RepID=G2PQ15_ALLRU|nr:collagen-like protein [Allomuricauda ruestringensis]AEM70480.1 hypothetical protein Murru_1439 [Allomuricauda ruestringensis DSM 13258]
MKSIRLFSMAVLGMAMVLVSCSGEDGEQGLQGKEGPQGPQGEQGDQGEPGQDGENRPNVDFYFQNGFDGYEGTQDVQISFNSGSTNNETLNLIEDLDADNHRYVLMRFDGISDYINSEFGSDHTNCGEDYIVTQAILYLYSTGTVAAGGFNQGYIHHGFYGPNDPIFNEEDATWTQANAVDSWFLPGAKSELFVGPFNGSDNYTAGLGTMVNSSQDLGWMALPLPQSVVTAWICDNIGEQGDANKGVRLRLSTEAVNGLSRIGFSSSEAIQTDLRPVLVIKTKEINNAGKGDIDSSKLKSWENMTTEERMAPLYEFLSKK